MVSLYLNNVLSSIESSLVDKKIVKKTVRHSEFVVKGKLKRKEIWMKLMKKKSAKGEKNENKEIKFDKKQYILEFNSKVKENKEFAGKLIVEQKARKVRQEKRDEVFLKRLEESAQEQERVKEELERHKEIKKQERLDLMVEKSKERKNYLKEMKELTEFEYKKTVSATPLYKKLELSYFSNVEMPELEKRKEELKKKHEKFKPIDFSKLKEHARQVDTLRTQHPEHLKEWKSVRIMRKSKLAEKLLRDDRERLKEEHDRILMRKNRVEKKKMYSDLVKALYSPLIDGLKQKEMALIKAKLEPPVIGRKVMKRGSLFNLSSVKAPQTQSPVGSFKRGNLLEVVQGDYKHSLSHSQL